MVRSIDIPIRIPIPIHISRLAVTMLPRSIPSLRIPIHHSNLTRGAIPSMPNLARTRSTPHLKLGRTGATTCSLRPHSRQQINKETHDPKGENEGDDPLEHSASLEPFRKRADGEGDGEGDLDEDEKELDPEGDAQDAEVALVHAEALVFGAEEDGGEEVAGDEEEEEDVVEAGVVEGVEDGEEDEAGGADDGPEDCVMGSLGMARFLGRGEKGGTYWRWRKAPFRSWMCFWLERRCGGASARRRRRGRGRWL